jgi:hypothetical protein
MSQVVNFPNSMDLRGVKATAEPTMKGEFLEFQSQNQSYGQREKIRIPISNTANTWLHGPDSFFSGRFKPTFTATGGSFKLMEPLFHYLETQDFFIIMFLLLNKLNVVDYGTLYLISKLDIMIDTQNKYHIA